MIAQEAVQVETLRRLAYVVEVMEFCAEELKSINVPLSQKVSDFSQAARAELDARSRSSLRRRATPGRRRVVNGRR